MNNYYKVKQINCLIIVEQKIEISRKFISTIIENKREKKSYFYH